VCGVTAAGVDSWVEDSDLVRGLLLVEDVFEVRVLGFVVGPKIRTW